MHRVLSTKILSKPQKHLLLNSGIGIVEYNAISIQFFNFDPEEKAIENAIISSQNAAKALIERKIQIRKCFCVGEKTASILNKHQYNIQEIAGCGEDLAKVISKDYSIEKFIFFCGNLKREELPSILNENKVEVKEIEVYKKEFNLKHFNGEFDGIMFFSPSGVQSFTSGNELKNSTAFCIGKTTASEAKKHTSNIIIATKPSIESVIVQVVKKFRQYD